MAKLIDCIYTKTSSPLFQLHNSSTNQSTSQPTPTRNKYQDGKTWHLSSNFVCFLNPFHYFTLFFIHMQYVCIKIVPNMPIKGPFCAGLPTTRLHAFEHERFTDSQVQSARETHAVLTPSLPRCHLKTTIKCAKFETLKHFFFLQNA